MSSFDLLRPHVPQARTLLDEIAQRARQQAHHEAHATWPPLVEATRLDFERRMALLTRDLVIAYLPWAASQPTPESTTLAWAVEAFGYDDHQT